jgi:3-deoxy-7-phosphoheptulonate synthase
MIIVMNSTATEGQIADIVERLSRDGVRVQRLDAERVALAATGARPDDALEAMPGVAAVLPDAGATPMVATPQRDHAGRTDPGDMARTDGAGSGHGDRESTAGFQVGEHRIGGGTFFCAAGPCSVEDPDTMHRIAGAVAAAGAVALRAGAYKPRSSPYSFQGMGEDGLAVAHAAAEAHGLLLVSEVLDATQIPIAARYVDILQVGARNMFNTTLLRELGRTHRPVLLKRGLAATIDEWLSAAEYIVSAGNPRVILCERGIRTFETATRNTLDLGALPVVRQRSHLPVLVDPSHAAGKRAYVRSMSRAAVAAGADGLLIEVHVDPDAATSDAAQTITPHALGRILQDARAIRNALDALDNGGR